MIDFNSGSFRYRLAHLKGRNELIAKAIGFRSDHPPTVYDVTAGLGREAFLLAALGCRVTLFERHPVVASNLRNAMEQAKRYPEFESIIQRMCLIPSCAIDYLKTHPPIEPPEVIYCDPMFAPRTKSAAVKKELQELQSLVGQDNDAAELIALAKLLATKRVVVKCALRSPLLAGEPHFSLKARSHRFDIYLK